MPHTHLVFVTKYRRNIFSKIILDDLKTIFESVCKDFNAELVEFDGEKDHVHLLINYPPKVSIAKLIWTRPHCKGFSQSFVNKV